MVTGFGGGGWLSQLGTNFGLGHGFVDFAGSSVVHAVGGFAGLAGAIVLGARIGKFNKDGSPNAIPGHDIPMAILGTLILAFGWFGFNPGSTLAGIDLRIAVVAVNTMLASAAGSISAMLYMWYTTGNPDPSMTANGMLAERVLKIDDPVGAVSVHGINGMWGCLALGLFADGKYGAGWNGVDGAVRGLFYGDPKQFIAQLIGCITCMTFVFVSFYIFFKISDAVMGIRVSKEREIKGLDLPEVGTLAYPDFQISEVISES